MPECTRWKPLRWALYVISMYALCHDSCMTKMSYSFTPLILKEKNHHHFSALPYVVLQYFYCVSFCHESAAFRARCSFTFLAPAFWMLPLASLAALWLFAILPLLSVPLLLTAGACLSVVAAFVLTCCCLSEIDQLEIEIDQFKDVISASVRDCSWLWGSVSELCEVVDAEADAEGVIAYSVRSTGWAVELTFVLWVCCMCDCVCVCWE